MKDNSSLLKRVQELESQIEKDKELVTEASGLMNRVIELGAVVSEKDTEIGSLKKAHDEAISLAEGRALEMEKSKGDLLSCMHEAKAIIDGVFAKGGMQASEELPETDPVHFADWLSSEIAQFQLLLQGSLDVGAYGAGFGLACTLQRLGCKHLKAIGKPPHHFPKPDVVRAAIGDNVIQNVLSRLLLRYWENGGRELALAVGDVKTREVI